MLKYALKLGWVIGSGLFFWAAFLLYARITENGLPNVGRDEGAALEAVKVSEVPDGLSFTPDHDEHEIPGDLRDIFTFKALPEAATARSLSNASFRVSGLIIGPQAGIVLEDLNSGRTVFLSEGETKDDLALLRVQVDGARVRVGGRELLLAAPSGME